MPNITEKTAANVFYQARIKASKHNEALSSREGAADIMAIDRGRLYRIESDVAAPYPEEVRMMADLYHEPELCNYYCRKCCPLGKNIPEIRTGNLDKITLDVVRVLKDVYKTRDTLLDITEDGIIDENEKEDLKTVLENLERIAQVTQELRTWVEKNL
ncbi:MAG: XRE family transcriptional regulator [Lachnospiraceae bacterium]|nr:XRE family transcriptional regulator [Lachnospiraceae bacterium]